MSLLVYKKTVHSAGGEGAIQILPSSEFQADLIKTQTEPSKVITDPFGEEHGLDLVKEFLEEGNNMLGLDVMKLDENHANMNRNGNNDNVEYEFQNLTDEKIEEDERIQDDVVDILRMQRAGEGSEYWRHGKEAGCP
ncbi:hypothetical protein Bca4012_061359 [Brassica carinata]|uniref:Uncharacterized protein n=1 Tax=Brassica carinata TaxID=52824 RepID=A0A8X7V5K2_BRACI|nr:hypothetical protein Bca52824_031653 [Brassica carinata]